VAEVTAEVAALPGRHLVFVDDNLTADRDYAARLCAALRPLRKRWIAQSDLRITRDPAFVRLLADAGCVGLFVGLETFREDNLAAVGKDCHLVAEYRQAIQLLHHHGIAVEAGDTPTTFRHTLQLLDDLQLDSIQVSIFTPLPGTPRHAALAGRLTDHDWEHYDFHHVLFQPAGLTATELQDGHDWVTARFYQPWRMVRRVVRHLGRPRWWAALPFLVTINLAYYGRVVRWHLRGRDPAARPAFAWRWPRPAPAFAGPVSMR
jgi:radical SAM superfamily enzyme YgiQ (UPF0313 family)